MSAGQFSKENGSRPIRDNHMNKDNKLTVESKFRSYPGEMRRKLLFLRQLITEVASETPGIGDIEEALKWGEPSYLAKGGSTVRIGWKANRPEYYAMYFNCNTKLVDTFKELYAESFNFEGNRAIVFHREDEVPSQALKHCIALSLQYHKLKSLPLLGA